MGDAARRGGARTRFGAARVRARGPGRRAVLVIGAVALLELSLVWIVLNPRTFFSGDAGVKYIQAANIAEARWRGLSIRNPAEPIDPDGRFSALTGSQFRRRAPGAPFYGAYAELFTVPVSVGLAWFGVRGIYLVPVLASVGAMVIAYRLSVRSARRLAWLAPLLVGGCSPMLFYSLDLWEHTLAVLLSSAGVLLFVAGTAEFALTRLALAGLAFGAAIWVREELYGFLPAILVALAWVERRRRIPAALTVGAAALLVLAPHWLLTWTQTGVPARIAVMRVLQPFTATPDISPASGLPTWRPVVALLLPVSAAWLLPVGAAVAVRLWLPNAPPRRQAQILATLVIAAAVWASGYALLFRWWWPRPDTLLQAFPAILFLLFLPPVAGGAGTAHREIRQLLAMAVVYTVAVCVAAPFALRTVPLGGAQWGPRFLMPLYPLLAAAIVFALERRIDWDARVEFAPRLLAGLFAVLLLVSVGVQAQGVRQLHRAKAGYEGLVAATGGFDAGGVVATDLWWFPDIIAAILYERPVVLVDVPGNGSLPELLARLQAHGIASLSLVSDQGRLGERYAAELAQLGWTESERQHVPMWLDVVLVSYRRAPSAPG